MDAPIYPPAIAYHRPAAASFEFGASTVALGDLLKAPAAAAIIYKEAPALRFVVKAPAFQAHMSNFTLYSLIDFGVVARPVVDRIDAELRALPSDQRPAL